MLSKLVDRLIDYWLRKCPHDDNHVAADILEGDGGVSVKYCRRCGAVRPEYSSEWRRARPLWFPVEG